MSLSIDGAVGNLDPERPVLGFGLFLNRGRGCGMCIARDKQDVGANARPARPQHEMNSSGDIAPALS